MKNKNVIVIGAGIAGLSAAHELKKNGCHVVLLEARNYLGGRIKFDSSLGVPFPCGAAFLHGLVNNPIYQLLQESKPVLKDFNHVPPIIFDKNKKIYSNSLLQKNNKQFEEILRDVRLLMANEIQDKSLFDVIYSLPQHQNIDNDFLNWELLYLSMFTGIDAKYLSAKNWDQMGELAGGDHLLLSTFDYIVDQLANNQDIFFNTIVNHVDYSGDILKITTNNGVYEADSVIVTVPLGVLKTKKIKFSPELPIGKRKSIHNLKMSALEKIGLLFPHQFWPKDIVAFGYNVDPINSTPLFFNYTYFFDKPVLLAAVSGDAAISLTSSSKTAFLDQTMNTLRDLFGSDIPDPIQAITTNWVNDPFSCGSYSYIPIGASGVDFDMLSEPVSNKLFFAGEATYRACHSTVQGAYLSGVREAKRILNTL